ncbi:MAG: UvrD-helicase domain-containing protein [Bacteroidales bacterium]|nr:UvrD-helicase domain-containing protein [Bacteroidales bacterium]
MSITVCRASAGSGKTHTLTRAFVRRLLGRESPTAYLHQMALTFTRKATEEMKVRIISLLNDLSLPPDDEQGVRLRREFCLEKECAGMGEEELRRRACALRSAILHDYGRFSVYTIDAFFQRIVRSFIWEAGLPSAYTVELNSQRLLQEAIDQVVDEVSTHPQNRKWIGDILSERIGEGKPWNVQKALEEVGKQVFNERFSSFGVAFANQLCDKAFLLSYMQELCTLEKQFRQQMEDHATEVLTFLSKNGLSTTDFRRKASSFMRYFDKVMEGAYKPTDSVLKALDDPAEWMTKNDPKAEQIEAIYHPLHSLMRQCIEYYNNHAPAWFAVRSALKWLPQMGLAADIQRHVRALLSKENAVHLSQTLLLLSALTSQSDAPFILERMGCRYSDFLLDEFQDTSVMQWNVMLPLIFNGLSQGGVSMVVGDVKQSIYRWRNSDWRILGGGIYGDLSPHKFIDKTLNVNWRSREVLTETVGTLFERLIQTVHQDFVSDLPSEASPELQAIPREIVKAYDDVRQQVAPPQKESGGFVAISSVEPTREQSAKAQILERLPHLMIELQKRGFCASDIAILVRTKEQGQQIATALMSFKERPEAHGYCFEVLSPDTLFLSHSPEVQLIVAIFKRFLRPHDALNNRLIEHLSKQLGTSCPDALWSGALQFHALPQAFEELIRVLKWTERHSCFAYIQELHNQILTFSKNHGGDVFSFVRWWNQNGHKVTLQLECSEIAINLLTIHKAKGLEYPVVVIPFCDWGLEYMSRQLPIVWAQPQEAPLNQLPFVPQRWSSDMKQSLFAHDYYYEKMQYLVDQLNVFYVAATRAKDELYLFLPQTASTTPNLASTLKEVLFPQGATTDRLTFGAFVSPKQKSHETAESATPLSQYVSSVSDLRLHTRLADESLVSEEISPRKRGVILHSLLSRINTLDEIGTAIETLVKEGVLAPDREEQCHYEQVIRNALAQPQALEWFDGSWTVRNEASILLPACDSHHIRPDRVMEKEGRVVVIDYKFGQPHPAHQHQMDKYVQALQQMGYKEVEGFVWYIQNIPIFVV